MVDQEALQESNPQGLHDVTYKARPSELALKTCHPNGILVLHSGGPCSPVSTVWLQNPQSPGPLISQLTSFIQCWKTVLKSLTLHSLVFTSHTASFSFVLPWEDIC